MAGLNLVLLLGRLTRDSELSYTPGGIAVCKFTLVTSKKKKDGSEISSFHRCIAFQKTGELINQYTEKGKELSVQGELSYGSYEKDGVTRYTTDIIVNQFQFISGGGSGNQNNRLSKNAQDQPAGSQRSMPYQSGVDDDIPF